MKAEDQHMDDIFRKAASEQQFAYQPDFWKEVESQLNDDSLDTAFKVAAEKAAIMPDFNLGEAIDDAFLDDSFKAAAEKTTVEMPAGAFESFLKEKAVLEQDAAFIAAANAVTADYHPVFWSDADQALRNEGLHYEYKSAYWNDAKSLLDHADRSIFFRRWSAVAGVLVLLSLLGFYQPANNNGRTNTPMIASHTTTTSGGEMIADETVADNNEQHAVIKANGNSDAQAISPDNHETNVTETPTNQQSHEPVEMVNRSTNEVEGTNVAGNEEPIVTMVSETNNQSDNGTVEQTTAIASGSTTQNSETTTRDNTTETVTTANVTNESVETVESTDNSLITLMPGTAVNGLVLNDAYLGPHVEIERFRLPSSHAISFVGSAGIGNKYGEVDFTPTYRTSFGFEYSHTGFGLLRNFEAGGNLAMNHVRQNGFGTERHADVFNVQGGVDKFWYKLQYKDMIYANAGIYLGYKLNQRHTLRTSLGVDYLVFVQSNMSYKVNADDGITTVNNNWGVKEGLNKVDLRFGLGYEFDITKRFAVQLNGSFGFFDRSDDSFISNTFLDHEVNATVGLKYTFLRKI